MEDTAKSQLQKYILELAFEKEHVPTEDEMDDAEGKPDAEVFIDHFGSWAAAINYAGLEQPKKPEVEGN